MVSSWKSLRSFTKTFLHITHICLWCIYTLGVIMGALDLHLFVPKLRLAGVMHFQSATILMFVRVIDLIMIIRQNRHNADKVSIVCYNWWWWWHWSTLIFLDLVAGWLNNSPSFCYFISLFFFLYNRFGVQILLFDLPDLCSFIFIVKRSSINTHWLDKLAITLAIVSYYLDLLSSLVGHCLSDLNHGSFRPHCLYLTPNSL